MVHGTGLKILEQVIWLLWELVGRNNFSTCVFPALVPSSYSISLNDLYVVECICERLNYFQRIIDWEFIHVINDC